MANVIFKDGSNWSSEINATKQTPYKVSFESGKVIEIVEYIKAHAVKKGSKTMVSFKFEGQTYNDVETDALRLQFCPDYKKGKHERKEKEVKTFAKVFEELKTLSSNATFDEVLDAFLFFQKLEATRRKEKEEAEEKEFAALEKRYKELKAKRTQQSTTKEKGKGKSKK